MLPMPMLPMPMLPMLPMLAMTMPIASNASLAKLPCGYVNVNTINANTKPMLTLPMLNANDSAANNYHNTIKKCKRLWRWPKTTFTSNTWCQLCSLVHLNHSPPKSPPIRSVAHQFDSYRSLIQFVVLRKFHPWTEWKFPWLTMKYHSKYYDLSQHSYAWY